MTASRFKLPVGGLRLAGLTLADFFKEDETEGGVGTFEGFLPGYKETATIKGRGGALSYKAPKMPTRTQEFTLTPEGLGSQSAVSVEINNLNQQQQEKAEGEEVQQKADRLLSSFIGEKGVTGAIGAMGVSRAQEYGYTDEEILSKARAEGLKFGEQAARGLGIDTNLASYTGPLATEGALGAASVERMRNQGLSDESIRSLAQQQGLKFGQGAAESLGVGDAQTYKPPTAVPASMPQLAGGGAGDAGSYVGLQGTSGSVGAAALKRSAAAQGISLQQAAKQAQAQGYNLGAAARAFL